MDPSSIGVPIIFGLIWLVFVISMLVGWIMTVMAFWRGMKAHESIARSISQYVRLQNHLARNELDEGGK